MAETGLIVIGLAGGIGAGKSAVAAELEKLGCVVSDSDAEAKAALNRPEVLEQLRAWWGPAVVGADGKADRAEIARVVFADPAQREKLEGLTHPIVHEQRAEGIARARAARSRAFVIDAPLLFEAGVDDECDAVIFVDAPRSVRLERVKLRSGWDELELARREAAQWPVERKCGASEVVVDNGGEARHLPAAVERALEEAIAVAGGAGEC